MKALVACMVSLALLFGFAALLLFWGTLVYGQSAAFDTAVFVLLLIAVAPFLGGQIGERNMVVLRTACSSILWCFLLIYVHPRFFSVPRHEAWALGAQHLSLSQELASRFDGFFPRSDTPRFRNVAEQSRGRENEDDESPVVCLQSTEQLLLQEDEDDEEWVALPFEWQGSAIKVPLTVVDEKGNETEVWMIYDTGATLTTMNQRALDRLQVRLPKDAPELRFKTANGYTKQSLAVVPGVWLGGYEVGRITVALCESCAGGEVAGLLGLNITSHFVATVDTVKQEVILKPREQERGKYKDIRHWVDISATISSEEIEFVVTNHSPALLQEIEVQVMCMEEKTFLFGELAKQSTRSQRFPLPDSWNCQDLRLRLVNANW